MNKIKKRVRNKECKNPDCYCKVKITHADTMKYRNRIVNMSTQEWIKWHRKLIECRGSTYFTRNSSFAFIAKGMKKKENLS